MKNILVDSRPWNYGRERWRKSRGVWISLNWIFYLTNYKKKKKLIKGFSNYFFKLILSGREREVSVDLAVLIS